MSYQVAAVRGKNFGGAGASGWWLGDDIPSANCLLCYQPKGAADYTASQVNLANPGTYDATAGNNPTFATGTGWSFDGSNNYLLTGLAPGAGTWTYIVQCANAIDSGDPVVWGERDQVVANSYVMMILYGGIGNNRLRHYNGPYADHTDAAKCSGGNYCIADRDGYYNGADLSITIGAFTGSSHNAMYVGAYNDRGSAASFYQGDIIAFAVYNITLTSTQISTLATSMAAL